VNRLLILEPEVRRFRTAFIVGKVESTVPGTPTGMCVKVTAGISSECVNPEGRFGIGSKANMFTDYLVRSDQIIGKRSRCSRCGEPVAGVPWERRDVRRRRVGN